MVPHVGLVEPPAVVAHEVAHAFIPRGGVEERERAIEACSPDVLVTALRERERHDREPSHVVDAVTAVAVGNDPVGVLHDPDVVGERPKVIGAQAREMQLGDACGPSSGSERTGFRQDGCGSFRHGRPRERRADAPRFRLRGGELGRVVEVAADCIGDGCRIVERNDLARARCEHVLRVPVRSRDDRATRGERERQRARRDLLAARVRRQEDIRLPEEQRELVDRKESIVEHDVRPETELERTLLEPEPVPLALAPRDVGMRAAGNRVDEVRIPLDDRRKRLDHGLDPLAGRDEAERRQADPRRRSPITRCDLCSRALAARAIRRAGAPCGTTRTLSAEHVPESTSSRSAVSVITITSSASLHSSVRTSA